MKEEMKKPELSDYGLIEEDSVTVSRWLRFEHRWNHEIMGYATVESRLYLHRGYKNGVRGWSYKHYIVGLFPSFGIYLLILNILGTGSWELLFAIPVGLAIGGIILSISLLLAHKIVQIFLTFIVSNFHIVQRHRYYHSALNEYNDEIGLFIRRRLWRLDWERDGKEKAWVMHPSLLKASLEKGYEDVSELAQCLICGETPGMGE